MTQSNSIRQSDMDVSKSDQVNWQDQVRDRLADTLLGKTDYPIKPFPGTEGLSVQSEIRSKSWLNKSESEVRDMLGKYLPAVFLNCTDAKLNKKCQLRSEENISGWKSIYTNKGEKISHQIASELLKGNDSSKLSSTTALTDLTWRRLGLKGLTQAPMLTQSVLYSDKITRDLGIEQRFIDRLQEHRGEIKQADLVRMALEVTNGDRDLAILTLFNFTKNMGNIIRRQSKENEIDPYLRNYYTRAKMDSIFGRLEGFADDRTQLYNKESSIYHFYWGLHLANQMGPKVANFLANLAEIKNPSDPISNGTTNIGVKTINLLRNKNFTQDGK